MGDVLRIHLRPVARVGVECALSVVLHGDLAAHWQVAYAAVGYAGLACLALWAAHHLEADK
jgi:hypothetical protein